MATDEKRDANANGIDDEIEPPVADVTAGSRQLVDRLEQHHGTDPTLSGGDVDARWEDAESGGDETVGGSTATPGQNDVESMGKALGVTYADNETLDPGKGGRARRPPMGTRSGLIRGLRRADDARRVARTRSTTGAPQLSSCSPSAELASRTLRRTGRFHGHFLNLAREISSSRRGNPQLRNGRCGSGHGLARHSRGGAVRLRAHEAAARARRASEPTDVSRI